MTFEMIYFLFGFGIGWCVAVILAVLWLDSEEVFDGERTSEDG